MVRELFELYATGEYSMKQIEVIFWNKGYRNSRGNRLSHTTMSNMISNPKYKGYYVGNKVKVIDMFTKKKICPGRTKNFERISRISTGYTVRVQYIFRVV